jgi:hypothetical protein
MLVLHGIPWKQAFHVNKWIRVVLAIIALPAYGMVTIGEQRQVDTIPPGSSDSTGGGKFIGTDGSQHFYVCWTEHPQFGSPRIYCRTYDQGGGELVPPQRVDRSPFSSAANVYGCNDKNGNIFVTWFRDTIAHGSDVTGNYYFNQSSDHGVSWSASDVRLNTRVQEAFYSKLPVLTCDGSGHVYFVESYKDAGVQHLYVRRSADYGATWDDEVRLDSQSIDNNGDFFAFPVTDAEGVVYVSFLSPGPGGNHLFINRSLDLGLTWLDQEVQVDHSPFGISAMINGYSPITTGAAGELYAAWSDGRISGFISVFLNQSADYGQSFQPTDTRISVDGEGASYENVAATSDGHVYAIYLSQTDIHDLLRVRMAISSDHGATWPVRNQVVGNTGITALYFWTPTIAADEQGRIYVMYVQYHRPERETDERVNVSSDFGLTWEGGEDGFSVITSAPSNSTEQIYRIGADQQGNAIAVWSEIQRPATNFHEQLNTINLSAGGPSDGGVDAGSCGTDAGTVDGGSDGGMHDGGGTDGGPHDGGSDGGGDGGSDDGLAFGVSTTDGAKCGCGTGGGPIMIGALALLLLWNRRGSKGRS